VVYKYLYVSTYHWVISSLKTLCEPGGKHILTKLIIGHIIRLKRESYETYNSKVISTTLLSVILNIFMRYIDIVLRKTLKLAA